MSGSDRCWEKSIVRFLNSEDSLRRGSILLKWAEMSSEIERRWKINTKKTGGNKENRSIGKFVFPYVLTQKGKAGSSLPSLSPKVFESPGDFDSS